MSIAHHEHLFIEAIKDGQFRIDSNNKQYLCSAHRLVWTYFKGEIPDNLQINHKSGVKTDNRPENLEVVTHSENTLHAYRTGIKQRLQGEDCGRAKLKVSDIIEIRTRNKSGETQTAIAKDFPVSSVNIGRIINNKLWRSVS